MFFGDHNAPHFHARYSRLGRASTKMSLGFAGSVPFDMTLQVPLNRFCERLFMVDISQVEVVAERTVRLWFSDGTERVVDLSPLLWGPAFAEITADDELFSAVRVDPGLGTITWPNDADLDPDVLHGDFEPPPKRRLRPDRASRNSRARLFVRSPQLRCRG